MDATEDATATATRAPVVETTGASVFAGTLWRTASQMAPQVYTLIISVAAARALGPDGMGRQSFIAFVEVSLVLLATGGVSVALTRFIGEEVGAGRPETVRSLLAWAWKLELGAGLLATAGMIGAALTRTELREAWVLAGIATLAGITNAVPSGLLTGLQRWRQSSILAFVVGPLSVVATVAVLRAGWGITGMFAVEVAAGVAMLVWTMVLAEQAVREFIPRVAVRPRVPRRAHTFALVATLEVLLTFIVWRRSEFIFLERFSTPTQIALYSIAFAATAALLRAFQALGGVLIPAVATLFGAGARDRIRTGFGRGLRLVLLMSIPVTAAGIALGPSLVRLVYGARYTDAGVVLVISMLAFPLLPLFTLAFALVAGLGRQRVPVLCGIGGAVVDVLLDVLLIPSHGAVGAAIANASAQVMSGLPVLVYGCMLAGPVEWEVPTMLRGCLVSACAGVVAWLVASAVGGRLAFPVGLAAGTPIFLAGAVVLRIVPRDDAVWLDGVLRRRFGRAVGRAVMSCATR